MIASKQVARFIHMDRYDGCKSAYVCTLRIGDCLLFYQVSPRSMRRVRQGIPNEKIGRDLYIDVSNEQSKRLLLERLDLYGIKDELGRDGHAS